MSLSDEQFAFMLDESRLIQYCAREGIKVTGGELWRPLEMQQIYYDRGLTKTLNSYHRKKLAIDLNFFINGELTYNKEDLQHIGDFWESLNQINEWGGNWELKKQDTPHFQRTVERHI